MINRAFIYPSVLFVVSGILSLALFFIRFFSYAYVGTYFYIPFTVVLLGFALSAAVVTLFEERIRKNDDVYLGVSLVGAILSTGIVYFLIRNAGFSFADNPEYITILKVIILYALMIVPFLLASFFVVLSFQLERHQLANIAIFKYLGGALGAGGFVVLLSVIPFNFLIYVPITALSLAALLIISKEKKYKLILLCIVVVSLIIPIFDVQVNFNKNKDIRQNTGSCQAEGRKGESLDGYLNIKLDCQGKLRVGISTKFSGVLPDFRDIYVDGNKVSQYVKGADRTFLNFSPSSVVYGLRPQAQTLVLNSGGGLDVLSGIHYEAKRIDAVEKNGQIIDILKENYSQYTAGIYHHRNVILYRSEIRSFVNSVQKRKYDLVKVNVPFQENSSFKEQPYFDVTKEALDDYFGLLNPQGIIVLDLPLQIPPRQELRLTVTIKKFLDERGFLEAKNLIIFKTPDTFIAIIAKGDFSEAQLGQAKAKIAELDYRLVYPGPGTGGEYERYIGAIMKNDKSVFGDYGYSLRPITDQQPFLSYGLKLSKMFSMDRIPVDESGNLILIISLILGAILTIGILFVPLSKRKDFSRKIHVKKVMIYFGGLGAGYIFIQMSLIQKLNFLVGNLNLVAGLVLASLFFFSALGIFLAKRIPKKVYALFLSLSAIVLMLVLYILFLDPVLNTVIGTTLLTRFIFVVLIPAPLALFLGVPFILGLEWLKHFEKRAMAFCWCIHSALSVVAVLLSIFLGIQLGLNWVFALSILFFGAAFASFIVMDNYYKQNDYLYRRYKL